MGSGTEALGAGTHTINAAANVAVISLPERSFITGASLVNVTRDASHQSTEGAPAII